MALAGLTDGRLALKGHIPPASEQICKAHAATLETLSPEKFTDAALADGRPMHDALMSVRGWPEIPFDGQLMVTHQDALLMGGKVQAMPGYADHVVFLDPALCAICEEKTCVSMGSGQAITRGDNNLPAFEREKCIHCGACLWNCPTPPAGQSSNVAFRAGSGGLHSTEN